MPYLHGYLYLSTCVNQYGAVFDSQGLRRLVAPAKGDQVRNAVLAEQFAGTEMASALDVLSAEGWDFVAITWQPQHIVLLRKPL